MKKKLSLFALLLALSGLSSIAQAYYYPNYGYGGYYNGYYNTGYSPSFYGYGNGYNGYYSPGYFGYGY